MIQFDTLDAAWRDERARRLAKFRRLPALAEYGLELGAMTVLAKRIRDRWGAVDLALDGREARILALLAVAYWHPVSPSVIGNLRRAAKAMARGDRALAAIHIAHSGLQKIDEDERTAFRLFAAERLLDAGVSPRELMTGLGLDPWPLDAIKFNPGEPRDERGRWTDGGGAIAAGAGGSDSTRSRQTAQEFLPPDFMLEEPPLEAPWGEFPWNAAKPPAPGFEWKGAPGSAPGDGNGNWFNPKTGESLRPDLGHEPPQGPHWDYKAPGGKWYRWLPDGTLAPKNLLIA
jgi:hypothetical protein